MIFICLGKLHNIFFCLGKQKYIFFYLLELTDMLLPQNVVSDVITAPNLGETT